MLHRPYSILGTLLLALSVASPALAAGKGKKKAADDSAQAADEAKADKVDDGGDKADKKSDNRGAKKRKKKGKKDDEAEEKSDKAEGETAGEASDEAAATTSATAEAADHSVWEKPPEDKEKPKPAEVRAPVEERRGDSRPISAGLELGWGLKTHRRTGGLGADPYTLTAGLRGGYEFDFKLYAGLFFNWYLGSSESGVQARANSALVTAHANYYQFGADIGYDWWIAEIIIRPSLGLGMAIAVTDVTGLTKAVTDFMAAPGLTVIYPWDNLFVGGELRANIVTGNGVSALLIAGQFGMRFEQ